MRTRALRNFHVPLSDELYTALRAEADRLGQPATALARQAIALWLKHRRRAVVHEAVATYATQQAGTAADLDRALEASGVEYLLLDEEEST